MSNLTSRPLDGINLLDWDIDSPSVFGKEHSEVSNFGVKPKQVVKSTTNDIVGGGYGRHALIDDPLSSTPVSSRQLPPSNANRQLPINYLHDLEDTKGSSLKRADLSDDIDLSDDDRDVAEVEKACAYVSTIVNNFNARKHTLKRRAKDMVETMNREINSVVGAPARAAFSTRAANNYGRPTFKAKEPHRISLDDSSADEDDCLPPRGNPKHVRFTESLRSSRPDSHGPRQDRNVRSDSVPSRDADHGDCSGAGAVTSINLDSVLQALSRLDGRTVPRPEQYNYVSGQGFSHFITSFEEYCNHNFRGCNTLWLGELARLLTGEMREVFDSVRVPGDTYDDVKEKLMTWTRSQEEVYEQQTKGRFSGASMKGGENVSRYGIRLESLFRVAYPNRNVQSSKTLKKKYMATVPSDFNQQLMTVGSVQKTLNQQELTWAAVMSVASQYDTTCRLDQPDEVWTTRRQPWAINTTDFDDEEYWDVHRPAMHSRRRRDSTVNTPRRRPVVTGANATRVYNRQPLYETWSSGVEPKPVVHERPLNLNRSKSEPRYAREMNHGARENEDTCTYCERPGHTKRVCRRFNRLCLICGSPDHFIRECSEIRRDLYDSAPRPGNFREYRSAQRSPNMAANTQEQRRTTSETRKPSGNA